MSKKSIIVKGQSLWRLYITSSSQRWRVLITEACNSNVMLLNIISQSSKFHLQPVLRNPSVLWCLTWQTKKNLSAFHSGTAEKRKRNKRNLAVKFVFLLVYLTTLYQLHQLQRIWVVAGWLYE